MKLFKIDILCIRKTIYCLEYSSRNVLENVIKAVYIMTRKVHSELHILIRFRRRKSGKILPLILFILDDGDLECFLVIVKSVKI